MSNPARRLTGLATMAALLLIVPATAQAATNFGSRLIHEPTETTCDMVAPCTIASYIHPSDPNGDPYSEGAPVDGVITKFRYIAYAVDEPGQITFRVADINLPDPGNDDSALASGAGTGPTVTLQPTESPDTPISEIGARLPVKRGQHLAVDMTKSIGIVYNSDGSKRSYLYAPPLVDGAPLRGSTEAVNELLVAATIEPDADGDGFGDETQDGCSRQATTQGPCDDAAPGVSGLRVKGGTVLYSLSEAGTVTFRLLKKIPARRVRGKCVRRTRKNRKRKACRKFRQVRNFVRAAGAGANEVRLPNRRKLRPGFYRLTMTVTDVAGNQSSKTTTFKVKKKKKKRRKRSR